MPIRMIIVDDEALSLETMEEYVTQLYPDAQLRTFTQPLHALEALRQTAADVALLDIQMTGGMNGIALAVQMKCIAPAIKILFCTGYSEYALDALKIHANGYLLKPILKDELKNELAYALHEHELKPTIKPYLRTFGSFDLFVQGEPVRFKRSKSKEVLAWLTDRKGAWVNYKELTANLWENYTLETVPAKYISLIITELLGDLERHGAKHIVEHKRGQIRLRLNEVECDYYAMLAGNVDALNQFNGEYMAQYSWGRNHIGKPFRSSDLSGKGSTSLLGGYAAQAAREL